MKQLLEIKLFKINELSEDEIKSITYNLLDISYRLINQKFISLDEIYTISIYKGESIKI